MTLEQIDLLADALEAQADACEITANAITLSAKLSEMSGEIGAARMGYAAAEGMLQASVCWTDRALLVVQSDQAQAAYLLETHHPALLEKLARITKRKSKRQVRLTKYQIAWAKLFRRDAQVIALNEELHARKNVVEAWAKAVGAWQQLRKTD